MKKQLDIARKPSTANRGSVPATAPVAPIVAPKPHAIEPKAEKATSKEVIVKENPKVEPPTSKQESTVSFWAIVGSLLVIALIVGFVYYLTYMSSY